MEIAFAGPNSIKIKSKNSSFVINPEKKSEGEVIVLTSKPVTYSDLTGYLVIDGPGEYEVSGVMIKAEKVEGGMAFDFIEDNQHLLLLSSPETIKTQDTEGYTAAVMLLGDYAGDLPSASSDVFAVVGSQVPESDAIKKIDKLNLKKIEEYKGFTVHLTK